MRSDNKKEDEKINKWPETTIIDLVDMWDFREFKLLMSRTRNVYASSKIILI